MSQPTNNTPAAAQNTGAKKAVWTDDDDKILLDVLKEQKDAGFQTDNGGFHSDAYKAAAVKFLGVVTRGGKKTSDVCKTRWTTVCNYNLLASVFLTVYFSAQERLQGGEGDPQQVRIWLGCLSRGSNCTTISLGCSDSGTCNFYVTSMAFKLIENLLGQANISSLAEEELSMVRLDP